MGADILLDQGGVRWGYRLKLGRGTCIDTGALTHDSRFRELARAPETGPTVTLDGSLTLGRGDEVGTLDCLDRVLQEESEGSGRWEC